MLRNGFMLALLALVVALPFVLRDNATVEPAATDETLVIITSQNEALRYEFGNGFTEWYFGKTGKRVDIDWRVPGGTRESIRFLRSAYEAAFEYYWTEVLGKKWNRTVQRAYANTSIVLPQNPSDDTEEQAIRRTFLEADLTSGIDLMFGGGKVDIEGIARRGLTQTTRVFETHPDWFTEGSLPQFAAGNMLWDSGHHWVGTALSGFGIIYNDASFNSHLSDYTPPHTWANLTEPQYMGTVALCDASSGSFSAIFELILQQEMDRHVRSGMSDKQAISQGWYDGLQLIQGIIANGRYFTDSATKPVLDVSNGDCAVGMTIDFYGLFQEYFLKARSDSQRFRFTLPSDGTLISPDPIALLRGAPNRDVAEAFIEYVLSIEGQKIWNFKVDAPGGPTRYAISRSPIRKELYAPEHLEHRLTPDLNMYNLPANFTYRAEWTSGLYNAMRYVIEAAFVDTHKELQCAMRAINHARDAGKNEAADNAQAYIQDLSMINYDFCVNTVQNALRAAEPLEKIRLRTELSRKFRRRYEEAIDLL